MGHSTWLRELRFLVEYFALLPILLLARNLPEWGTRPFVSVVGSLLYYVLKFDRRWALRNLEMVYGDALSPAQRRRIARRSFQFIVQTRIEMLQWTSDRAATHIANNNPEELERGVEFLAQGQGVIVITAHLGNYELAGFCIARNGYPGAVLYRPQDNWRIERLLGQYRAKVVAGAEDVTFVPRNPFGLISLAHSLREGKAIALLIDQNTLTKPTFVDFLGYPAASSSAAATLALATKAPVFLALTLRQADGTYRRFIEAIDTIDTGDYGADIRANTQRFNHALEKYILAYPEQYNWPHPRWRFRPDGSFWRYDTPLDVMRAECTRPPLLDRAA